MIADLVARLIAAGTAPEVAASVVAEAFAAGVSTVSADVRGHSADVQAERRREKDRLRKQAQRENPQNSADVRGNPQNSENASLSKNNITNNLSVERESGNQPRPRTSRGHRLPDDWHPCETDWQQTIELIGSQRAQGELEKFLDHWKQQPGSKGIKLDWDAAWRNWTRRAAEYQSRGPNNERSGSVFANSRPQQSGSSAVLAGVAAAAERRARERVAAGQQRPPDAKVNAAAIDDPDFFGAR